MTAPPHTCTHAHTHTRSHAHTLAGCMHWPDASQIFRQPCLHAMRCAALTGSHIGCRVYPELPTWRVAVRMSHPPPRTESWRRRCSWKARAHPQTCTHSTDLRLPRLPVVGYSSSGASPAGRGYSCMPRLYLQGVSHRSDHRHTAAATSAPPPPKPGSKRALLRACAARAPRFAPPHASCARVPLAPSCSASSPELLYSWSS